MADSDDDPTPQPMPFPIKIVPPDPPESDDGPQQQDTPSGKRNDEFYPTWEKFLAAAPSRAKKTSRLARKVQETKDAAAEGSPEGLEVKQNAATSWEEAAAACKAKVAAIIEECQRLNQKYRDAVFDLEASVFCLQSLTGRMPKAVDKIDAPPWIKRVEDIFDDPQFFVDGATATDVHQGSGGDCWFLASLMAISAKKELIENLCVARDEKIGVYGFVFYRDGEWIHEVIDDKLFLRVGDDDDLTVVRDWDKDKRGGLRLKADEDKLKETLQRGGEALYFSHCKSSETWLPLIEKAYAKAHGDYSAIEGGFASEGIEDLTGGVGVTLNPEDIMDKDRFWREQLSQVNKKYLFGGGSKQSATKGMVGGHAYAVLQAWEEGDLKLLKLRNPWGDTEWEGDWSDGSKLWTPQMMEKLGHTFGDDGVFWISYKDFLKHFPTINRVRLFSSDWSVVQQWTSVNVPWTVDYLDTNFELTITKASPTVIVLCQPDDRFFYGLRGRYLYSFHFRIYKDGDEEGRYLVRSMHNSGNETVFTRSVSAEVDLEPGTYSIVFKITATRSTISSTAEEIIQKYCVDRKEKLLYTGRRFDIAHSKGRLKEMEEANRKRAIREVKERQKVKWQKGRRLNKEDKARARRRKERINAAMQEKRKAAEQRRAEKAAARRKEFPSDSDTTREGAPRGEEESVKAEVVTPTEEEEAAKTAEVANTEEVAKTEDADKTGEIANAGKAAKPEEAAASGDEQLKDDAPAGDDAEALTVGLKKLELNVSEPDRGQPPSSRNDEEEDDSEPELTELDDDDFSWDDDMDGPVDSGSEDDTPEPPSTSPPNDLFEEDPWSAIAVVGLRVYSQDKDMQVKLMKPDDGSQDIEEGEHK